MEQKKIIVVDSLVIDEQQYINCCPHDLQISTPDGSGVVTLKKSGVIPRVESRKEVIGVLHTEVGDINIYSEVMGKPIDLPKKQPGVTLVVSRIVRDAAVEADPTRSSDLVAPGMLLRDDGGNPVGAEGIAYKA